MNDPQKNGPAAMFCESHLRIAAADGRGGAASLLLGGKGVRVKQTAEGVELSLPADVGRNAVDTVIVLK